MIHQYPIIKVPEVQPIRTLQAHLNSVQTLASHSNCLATGSHDHTIKIWDVEKGVSTLTLRGHREGIWSVDFSKDGKSLLSGSPDSTICIWDIKSGKQSKVMKGHRSKVYYAKYNENDLLVGSGGDSELIIWDMRKGTIFSGITSQRSNHIIYGLQWSRNGEYLGTAETGGLVNLYETSKFSIQSSNEMNEPSTKAYSIDLNYTRPELRNKVFVSSSEKFVSVYNAIKGKPLQLVKQWMAHMDGVKSIKLLPESNAILTSGRDGSIHMWEGKGLYRMKLTLVGHTDNVSQTTEVGGNQKILASGSWDQKVNIYKL